MQELISPHDCYPIINKNLGMKSKKSCTDFKKLRNNLEKFINFVVKCFLLG